MNVTTLYLSYIYMSYHILFKGMHFALSYSTRCNPPGIKIDILAKRHMSFESLGFAYHRGVDNKFTYTLCFTQILLVLYKRQNKVYIIKMLKHQAQTGFGTEGVFDVFCI